jgi:DNA-binding NtrC family response regulator
MIDRKILDQVDQFDALTIKRQMKILAGKAAKSRLFYKEIIEEFERTLLTTMLEKNDFNLIRTALDLKLHRNTISQKVKKLKIKEKKQKTI